MTSRQRIARKTSHRGLTYARALLFDDNTRYRTLLKTYYYSLSFIIYLGPSTLSWINDRYHFL